ncbi:MAG: Bug family tripartite tricarboxylate transporter substrate binding protein [Gemmatimonas sp.]
MRQEPRTAPRRRKVLATALIVLVAAFAAPASAEVNLQGQTIRFVIGLRPGGGTDLQARLVGPYLTKYLPGNPRVVFNNMPGAGGMNALNYIANAVKPDGTTIIAASASDLNPRQLKSEQAKYDANTLGYFGGIAPAGTFLMIRKDALPRLADRSKPPVIVADADGLRSGVMMAAWGVLYLNWNLRWVLGYPGTSEMVLAVQRGEADLTATAGIGLIHAMMESGQIVPISQVGTFSDGKIVRRKAFQDVPLITELLEGKMDAEGAEAMRTWVPGNQIGKWFALPPGTSPELLAAYRAAFDKVGQDAEFIRIGQQQIDPDFDTMSGQDVEDVAKLLANASPESQRFMDGVGRKIESLRASPAAAR